MIAISTIDKAVVGLFGFTLQIDMTDLLMDKIKAVQVGNYPTIAETQLLGNFPKPVTNETSIEVLQSYLNNPNAPRLAFNAQNGGLTIFCKNAEGVSDYADSTRYRVGDYVKQATDDSLDAIWKCVAEGISTGTATWAETGVTETTGLQWEFVDYLPISDTIVYAATTFLEIFGWRNSQPCSLDADLVDVPDKDFNLMLNYALATVWNMKKQYIPIKIQNIIDDEELRIQNE